MKKITLKQIGSAKVNPVFKDLPDELKDPKKFRKIEDKIMATMVSDHKHRKMENFMKCERCIAKRKRKLKAIKDFGFQNTEQYQNWKKVMTIIISKQNLYLHVKEK